MPFPTTKYELTPPSIEDVQASFEKSLRTNFVECSVEIVDCLDLTQAPWNMAMSGLGGSPRVADVGGVPNLIPLVNVDKQYNLDEVAGACDLPGGYVIGASAVASKLVNGNAELVNNVKTSGGGSGDKGGIVRSKYTQITDDKNNYKCMDYPHNELGLLGNLYLCEGGPGKVLKVTAKNRKGSLNFINCLNKGLGECFEQPVAIGGTFILKKGKAKLHVMPRQFSCTPLKTDEDVSHWLKFFEMSSPLIHTSVFISKDPGLDLRLEHSHCFSDHGDGGHYHFDTTPDVVEYEGYFNIAEFIYRVDPPADTHMVGRD